MVLCFLGKKKSKIVLQWIKIIVFGPSLEFVEMKKSIHSLFIIYFLQTKITLLT